jgi:hypothetical protein
VRGFASVLRVVAGCCAAAGLAGCAAGTAASQPAARPDYPPVRAAAPAGDPRVLARQAYLGMWQAFLAASRTADYQSPALEHYAAGAALTLLIRGLYENHRHGIVTRGQPAYRPVVTMAKTAQGTAQAKVADCADDTHATTFYTSGKPAPGQPPGRHAVYAWAQPFDGTWKVTYLVVERAGTCA